MRPDRPIIEVGSEWLVDAYGCLPERLSDLTRLQNLMTRAVRELDLKVVGTPQWHQFPDPGGVTGLYLLTESHLACHTYPELCVATFNLYCCRAAVEWPWVMRLTETLAATEVQTRMLTRGRV